MPALISRGYFRAHGVRGLERSILRFAGVKPVRETPFGIVWFRTPAVHMLGETALGGLALLGGRHGGKRVHPRQCRTPPALPPG